MNPGGRILPAGSKSRWAAVSRTAAESKMGHGLEDRSHLVGPEVRWALTEVSKVAC